MEEREDEKRNGGGADASVNSSHHGKMDFCSLDVSAWRTCIISLLTVGKFDIPFVVLYSFRPSCMMMYRVITLARHHQGSGARGAQRVKVLTGRYPSEISIYPSWIDHPSDEVGGFGWVRE